MTDYSDDDIDEIVGFGSLREIMMSDSAPSKDWSTKRSSNVKVTLDGARSDAWVKAKEEICFVRDRIRSLLGVRRGSCMPDLIDLMFGEKSEIWTSFSKNICLTHDKFIRFLGVFYIGCCHNKSCTQIYSDRSFIRKYAVKLLSQSDYNEIWDLISKTSLPLRIGQMAFWIELQTAFNTTCRKLFIEGSHNIDLDIVIDDDKIIFNTLKAESDGLKVVRHVNDNRNGHIFHTAAYTFSGLVIGIEAERSEDDTTGSATKRLIMNQLCPSHGTSGPPDLTGVRIHSDRAYWTDEFEEFILLSGADVGAGTRKRCKGFPYTFEQNISSNDPREEIPTTGFRRLFIKTRRHNGREVTAVAYRNNGNVTLGMSTIHSDHEWDLVLENPLDRTNAKEPEWKFNSVLDTALVDYNKCKVDRRALHVLLSSLTVDYITTDQNSPGWFLLRSFAITSSAADGLIDELLKDFKRKKLPDTLSSNSRVVFRYLCKTIGPATSREDEKESSEEESEERSDDGSEDDGREFNIRNLEGNIVSWNNGGSTAAMIEALEDEEAVRAMDNQLLTQYVSRMGGKPKQSKASNKGAIIDWLKASQKARPYIFKTKKELLDLLAVAGDRPRSSYNSMNVQQLIGELVGDFVGQEGEETVIER